MNYFKRLLSEGDSGLLLDELESVKLNIIDLEILFNELVVIIQILRSSKKNFLFDFF